MVSPGELLVELDAESERKRLEEATVQLAAIGPELDALRRALVAEEQAITSDRGATAIALDQVPARLLASWSQGFAAVEAGGLLKQRLLAGAVELSPDVVRDQGAGQLLGCIFESEAVESLALNGGVIGLVALVEVAFAGVILGLGAGGLLHLGLLMFTVVASAGIAWRYSEGRSEWTAARLSMTHDLVERMVGHRTRLAQQDPLRRHEGEDSALDRYLELARRMDAHAIRLVAIAPRGWIVLGLLGLLPAFAAGSSSPGALAVAVGGVLLAHRALRKLMVGFASLAGATIAWRAVAPIFHAAALAERPLGPEPAAPRPRPCPEEKEMALPILEAREVVFRYRDRGEPVLRGCTLRLHPGDRVADRGELGRGQIHARGSPRRATRARVRPPPPRRSRSEDARP